MHIVVEPFSSASGLQTQVTGTGTGVDTSTSVGYRYKCRYTGYGHFLLHDCGHFLFAPCLVS